MAGRARPSDPAVPRWGSHPGLCASCAHARAIKGARSMFWMCGLAASDPGFQRYPPLPVLCCPGHTAGRPLTEEIDAAP